MGLAWRREISGGKGKKPSSEDVAKERRLSGCGKDDNIGMAVFR